MNKRQEKLQESIINLTAQLIHERHLHFVGLRTSKPSTAQLYKEVIDYINLGLDNIKKEYELDIIPIKNRNSLVLDERIVDILKPTIYEYAVYEYSFYIVRKGNKRKYTITASGIVKEGTASKLSEQFIKQYIVLMSVVNELLEYGTMMGLNQLNSTGTLYIDEELVDILEETVIEQVDNDQNDTNNNTNRDRLYDKLDQIIHIFIDPEVNMMYAMDTESTKRPLISVETVDKNDGSDLVQVGFVEGKYETIRTTGNEIDDLVIGTICTFMYAVDVIFSAMVKELLLERLNV